MELETLREANYLRELIQEIDSFLSLYENSDLDNVKIIPLFKQIVDGSNSYEYLLTFKENRDYLIENAKTILEKRLEDLEKQFKEL